MHKSLKLLARLSSWPKYCNDLSFLGPLDDRELGHAHSSRAMDSGLGGERDGFFLLLSVSAASRDVSEMGHEGRSGPQGQPDYEKEEHPEDQVSVTACN